MGTVERIQQDSTTLQNSVLFIDSFGAGIYSSAGFNRYKPVRLSTWGGFAPTEVLGSLAPDIPNDEKVDVFLDERLVGKRISDSSGRGGIWKLEESGGVKKFTISGTFDDWVYELSVDDKTLEDLVNSLGGPEKISTVFLAMPSLAFRYYVGLKVSKERFGKRIRYESFVAFATVFPHLEFSKAAISFKSETQTGILHEAPQERLSEEPPERSIEALPTNLLPKKIAMQSHNSKSIDVDKININCTSETESKIVTESLPDAEQPFESEDLCDSDVSNSHHKIKLVADEHPNQEYFSGLKDIIVLLDENLRSSMAASIYLHAKECDDLIVVEFGFFRKRYRSIFRKLFPNSMAVDVGKNWVMDLSAGLKDLSNDLECESDGGIVAVIGSEILLSDPDIFWAFFHNVPNHVPVRFFSSNASAAFLFSQKISDLGKYVPNVFLYLSFHDFQRAKVRATFGEINISEISLLSYIDREEVFRYPERENLFSKIKLVPV